MNSIEHAAPAGFIRKKHCDHERICTDCPWKHACMPPPHTFTKKEDPLSSFMQHPRRLFPAPDDCIRAIWKSARAPHTEYSFHPERLSDSPASGTIESDFCRDTGLNANAPFPSRSDADVSLVNETQINEALHSIVCTEQALAQLLHAESEKMQKTANTAKSPAELIEASRCVQAILVHAAALTEKQLQALKLLLSVCH